MGKAPAWLPLAALAAGLIGGFLLAVALGLVFVAAAPAHGVVMVYRHAVCLGFGIGAGILFGIVVVNALVGALDRAKTGASSLGPGAPQGVTRPQPGVPQGVTLSQPGNTGQNAS